MELVPNPNPSQLIIHNPGKEIFDLSIYNVQEELLYKDQIFSSDERMGISLEPISSQLSSGSYYIVAQTSSGTGAQTKMIVTK